MTHALGASLSWQRGGAMGPPPTAIYSDRPASLDESYLSTPARSKNQAFLQQETSFQHISVKTGVWITSGRRRSAKLCCSFHRILKTHIYNFCRKTTLHGLQYTSSQQYHWTERVLWLAICILGVVMAVIMIHVMWRRFRDSPTVTTVESMAYPIKSVPFPAVTICNSNMVDRSLALTLANQWKEDGLNYSLALEFLRRLPQLIHPWPNQQLAHLKEVEDFLEAKGTSITMIMKKVRQPCERLLIRCAWKGEERNCSGLFRVIKSIEGFCCSFNYHGVYPHLDESPEFPDDIFKTNGAGLNAGLAVLLDCEPDGYFAPLFNYYGVNVLLHDPQDFPETSLLKGIVHPGELGVFTLDARVIESEPQVRRLDPQMRKCWFDDEVERIASADDYSYQTCVTECRAAAIIKRCGCIPSYYPYIRETRLCQLQDSQCLHKQRRALTGQFLPEYDGLNCTCLRQCSDKFYILNVIHSTMSPELNEASYITRGITSPNVTVIQVFFSDTFCIKYRCTANMTWDALFAAFGGIFGLCMGGSIMSLVEIVYYFTFRLWWSLHRQPQKSQQQDGMKTKAPRNPPENFITGIS